MTDSDGARLSPDFVQRLNQALAALGAQAPVLHLWHAWREPLAAARDAALQDLRARGHRTQLCAAGEFLPLLQTLNTLIADSLRGAPLPPAQQVGVWVVEGVQALPAEHAALLERVLVHFPELPLRLVLLSQTPLAPTMPLAPASTPLLEVAWREAEAPHPVWTAVQADSPLAPPAPLAPLARQARARMAWWLGGAALLVLLVAGAWQGWGAAWWLPAARPSAEVARASVPAMAPASEADRATLPAVEASVADANVTATPAPAQASAAAQPSTTPAVAASAPASAPVPVPTPQAAPRSALQAWVQTLPEGSFLVLHGQFASAREAEAFKASDPVLANARIALAVWAAGQPARHGVLTGPFRSPERVSNYLQRLAWREQARSIGREALLATLSP